MTQPTAQNCLGGTNAVSYCGLDSTSVNTNSVVYYPTKTQEEYRQSMTFEDGDILVFGCSNMNYVTPKFLNPYAVKVSCWGTSLRHLGQWLNQPDVQNMAQRAGAIVIWGMLQNWIDQEYVGRTDGQVAANMHYIMAPLANWLTGKGVIVEATPVKDGYLPSGSNLTNGRINDVNAIVNTYFGTKTGWKIAQVNAALKNSSGQLADAYYDASLHPHLNKAAKIIERDAINACLTDLGVI